MAGDLLRAPLKNTWYLVGDSRSVRLSNVESCGPLSKTSSCFTLCQIGFKARHISRGLGMVRSVHNFDLN